MFYATARVFKLESTPGGDAHHLATQAIARAQEMIEFVASQPSENPTAVAPDEFVLEVERHRQRLGGHYFRRDDLSSLYEKYA